MDSYNVIWHRKAVKELKLIPKNDIAKITAVVSALATNPFPQGYKKLTGSENNYRIRQGQYRVIYTVENNNLIIEVVRVAHRRNVYRNL